jgi:hypothetical protein
MHISLLPTSLAVADAEDSSISATAEVRLQGRMLDEIVIECIQQTVVRASQVAGHGAEQSLQLQQKLLSVI